MVEVREVRVTDLKENEVRESEAVREGSEKSEKGVTKHTVEVVGATVVSILSLNHLQVSFSSLPTIFPSSMSSRMCVVGQPCNFCLFCGLRFLFWWSTKICGLTHCEKFVDVCGKK